MTLDTKYTTNVFDNLVQLTISLRPDWQSPGIRAAIRDALAKPDTIALPDLAYALTRLALDPTIVTPAVLAHDGPHWRKTPTAGDVYRSAKCDKCGGRHGSGADCNPTGAAATPEARQQRLTAGVAACRAQLRPTRTYEPTTPAEHDERLGASRNPPTRSHQRHAERRTDHPRCGWLPRGTRRLTAAHSARCAMTRPLDVPCPVCQAPAGEGCVWSWPGWPKAEPVTYAHGPRWGALLTTPPAEHS